MSSRFAVLRETLQLCKRAFADVSFVPGNHDVWVTRGEPPTHEQARAVNALCDELGVRRTPAIMGGCVVAPLCAWHHAAFDREPDVVGWTGLPPASRVISDFYLCKFLGLSLCGNQPVCRVHFSAMTRPCWLRRAMRTASPRHRAGVRRRRRNFDFHTGLSQTDDGRGALDARNDDGAIAALRRAHPRCRS